MRNNLIFCSFVLFLTFTHSGYASVTDADLEIAVNMYNPFNKVPKPVDPITKEVYKQVVVGPSYLAPRDANYEYFRYVTFYNTDESKERIHSLPIQREACHDNGETFASYSFSYTFTSTITAGITLEGLGLSGSLSDSKTVTTSRNLKASGYVADHTPYFLKQNWVGKTYIQVYHSDTGKTGFIVKINSKSPRSLRVMASQLPYPFPFEVRDADWVFAVERKILETCQ